MSTIAPARIRIAFSILINVGLCSLGEFFFLFTSALYRAAKGRKVTKCQTTNCRFCRSRGNEAHFVRQTGIISEPPYVGSCFLNGLLTVQRLTGSTTLVIAAPPHRAFPQLSVRLSAKRKEPVQSRLRRRPAWQSHPKWISHRSKEIKDCPTSRGENCGGRAECKEEFPRFLDRALRP